MVSLLDQNLFFRLKRSIREQQKADNKIKIQRAHYFLRVIYPTLSFIIIIIIMKVIYPTFCIVFVVVFWMTGILHYWSHGTGEEVEKK